MEPLAGILGESPGIVALKDAILRLLRGLSRARRAPPVLIRGETGTGKGLVAQALHAASPRARGPFVDVNCAAIPATLLESEMFGVERGAFTDARQSKPGLFQLAHGGTIFLDEIGLLSEGLQAKLLKVIEEQTVRRLGSTRNEPIDVWVLAATNEELGTAIRDGRFRADLYHRLAVVTLTLPPLRERGVDVVNLARHFLARACADYGLPPKSLAAAAESVLAAYPWPGNVRELSNVMERVALLSEASRVTAESLGLPGASVPSAPRYVPAEPVGTPGAVTEDVERERILSALTETGWNITRTATRLGMSRNTLRYRMEKYALAPSHAAPAGTKEVTDARTVEAPPEKVPALEALGSGGRRRLTLLRVALKAPDSTGAVGRAVQVAVEKIASFGGRVEERAASGLLAVFGHEPIEDAPVRAALAATAIHNANERARGQHDAAPEMAIAIHVDHFPADVRGGRALDGDVKADADRFLRALLETAAPPATVVSEAAVPFLERRFELTPVPGALVSAGRVYGLTGLGAGSRAGWRQAGFIGRRGELDLLQSYFNDIVDGRGHFVGITGEPGIGKSRLLVELRERIGAREQGWLEGRCTAYGHSIPLLPVVDLVRAAAGIDPLDAPEVAIAKARDLLGRVGLAAHDAACLALLGLKDDTDMFAEASPEVVKAAIFETVRTMLLRLVALHPLVLVVEDLHWIDETSSELLATLVDMLPGAPLLFVATYRPGFRPSWMDRSYATQMALSPLRPDESRLVVRALTETQAFGEPIVDAILVKADGNPFFLEELVRVVRETGGTVPSAVPDTVEEVLLARVDRLPPEETHLLRAAAVIGKDFEAGLLEVVARLPEGMVKRSLANLLSAEFLRASAAGLSPRYTFKHGLTQEVVYATVPANHRRALHAAIGEAMERLYEDRLTEHIEELARHAWLGEVFDKAVIYLRAAGTRATARSANREAGAHLDLAVQAAERLPPSRSHRELAIDLRFELRTALLPLGELDRVYERLQEAGALLHGVDDPARTAQHAMYMTNHCFLKGDLGRALEFAERAFAIAGKGQDLALRLESQLRLGQVYEACGEHRRAVEVLRAAVAGVSGAAVHARFGLPVTFAVGARSWLARALAELGDMAEADEVATEALNVAEATAQPIDLVVAAYAAGMVALRRGEPGAARPLMERALALCRAWYIGVWLGRVTALLGMILTATGDVDAGVALLREAIDHETSMRRAGGHALSLSWLADGYLTMGRLPTASETAQRALEMARAHRERSDEGWIQRLIGEIALAATPPDRTAARRAFEDARARAVELGMRPLAAHAADGLARAREDEASP